MLACISVIGLRDQSDLSLFKPLAGGSSSTACARFAASSAALLAFVGRLRFLPKTKAPPTAAAAAAKLITPLAEKYQQESRPQLPASRSQQT